MDLTIRPRRLRTSETLRKMVRETRMDPASLIYPMFVMDGENKVEEIESLPGQNRYTVDRMGEELERLLDAGVTNVMFFGIPEIKDEVGSQAIGFYFDPGNMAVFQYPHHWVRILGNHIKMVHMKEWKGNATNGC